MTNTIDLKKTITTLTITILLTSTIAFIGITVAGANELTVNLSGIPATATHPSIELETWGDGTAEWTTEAPTGYIGDYCVKLTKKSAAKFSYGETLGTLAAIGTDNMIFRFYHESGIMNPYGILYLDTNLDGEVDALLVAKTILEPQSVWCDGKMQVGHWSPRGYDEGTLSTPATVCGEEYPVTDKSLAEWVAENDCWKNAIVMYVAQGGYDGVVYVDDITIGGVPYAFESSGNVEDTVTVSGTEATPYSPVEIYWENLGGAKLGDGFADGTGVYSIDIEIPEDVAGAHDIVAKDASDDTAGAEFIIEPEIVLTPTSGLPEDEVTVTGTGFAAESDIDIEFDVYDFYEDGEDLLTSSLGSFTATFDVPDEDYYIYEVKAEDGEENYATAEFTITATITLTPDEGPSGTVVDVSGIGFDPLSEVNIEFAEDSVYWEGVELPAIDVDSDGTFSASFVVPTVGELELYTVTAIGEYEDVPIEIEDLYNVTGLTAITLTPVAGAPDSEVTIEGINFTATADTEVTVKFGAVPVKTLYTNATGGFKGTFDVPFLPTEKYSVTATDDNNLEATADFTLAIIFTALTPSIGPTGTEVTIIGYGFTGDYANVTFGDILVSMNELKADILDGKATFYVPTVAVGEYTVTVEDSDDLTYSVSFDVNATTELILTPSSAPVGYKVSIDGNYFSPGSTVELVLYNETDSLTIAATQDTDEKGNFTIIWTVDTALTIGSYKINATDAETFPGDLKLIRVLEVPFSVVEVYIEIHTVSEEYNPGDTVSFYVNSTFAFNLEIDVKDPDGYPFTTINCTGKWVQVGDYYVVPYSDASFDLLSDALLGSWNWTAYEVTKEAREKVATGVFTVLEVVPPELPQLIITYSPETVYQYDIVTVNVTVEGTPIAGASVTIIDPDGISLDRTTTAAGTCTFTADEVGGWSVLASKSSYTDAESVTITVLERPAVTEYSIELTEGWNLVSLPLIPDNSSIEAVLVDVMENVTVVYAYNATAEKWSIYNPAAPDVSDLTIMVDGKGYWIKMSASATLIVHGTEMPEDPKAPLPEYLVVEGWNLIGYKETYSRKVSEYLSGVEYSTVYGYWDGAYHRLGADDLMEPGRAYWVAVTAEGTIYP